MTPLSTENLELKLEDKIVHMSITGNIKPESMTQGLDWIHELDAEDDDFNLRIDMAQSEFDDLAAISAEFKRVATVLRHSKSAKKCALMTDSMFLRNSAKVEGAVIPGLEVRTFDLDETTPAERWLKGEPLVQEGDEGYEPEASNDQVDEESDNPWDSLKMKNVNV